jgi:DUF4097 and DUF4098 domain-containing protein YvlB
MAEKSFELNSEQNLNITLRGDLLIHGQKGNDIQVSGDKFEFEESKSGLILNGSGDLKLRLPSSMDLNVLSVNGDCAIEDLSGSTFIEEIKGDLSLKRMGNISVSNVNGDLTGRNIDGDLSINNVRGDVLVRNIQDLALSELGGDITATNVEGSISLRRINGDVKVRHVTGNLDIAEGGRDLNLRNVSGLVNIGKIRGDIRLRGALAPGKHHFNASGDIVIRWPKKVPLLVEATASEIRDRLSLEVVSQEKGYFSGKMGSGDSILILIAEGRIILKEDSEQNDSWDGYQEFEFDIASDLDGLGVYIAGEINSRLTEWSTRLEKEFGPAFTAKIEKTAQEASARAEHAAERAVRKAEKAAIKARWHTSQNHWSPPQPPRPRAQSKAANMSEEEKLKVLRMVEKGIISPDEASTLLEAIEG